MNRPHPSGGLRPAVPQEKHSGRTDRPSPRGSPEGSPPPLGRRAALGDVPPVSKTTSEGGRVGPSRSHRRETHRPRHNPRPTPALGTTSPSKTRPARCHLPLPPHPLHPLPYPHAHAHAPDRATPPAPPADHECGRRHRRRRRPPCQGVGAGWALPCFPLSVSRHFPPRPSAHVRPAPCQIRLVPLFRPFQHPPAGPLAPHPVRACQIRLVSLCRLVRRASIPSCAVSLQARRSRKKRATLFKAIQTLRRRPTPQGVGAGLALPCRRPRRRVPYGETHPQTRRRP